MQFKIKKQVNVITVFPKRVTLIFENIFYANFPLNNNNIQIQMLR